MNQYLVRKIIGDSYKYKRIYDFLSDDNIEKGEKKLEKNFKKIVGDWGKERNSEWVVRNYLAVKMIMSSTLMLTSLQFGIKRNIKITEPYLIYYSLLNIARSVVFTNPNIEWREGGIMTLSHSKIIKIAGESIIQFSSEVGSKILDIFIRAKENREIFSYKFPAEAAFDLGISIEDTIEICGFLAEIAQFQSEILEKVNAQNTDNSESKLVDSILNKGFIYSGKTFELFDNDDAYRLDYIRRKQPFPVSLHLTLTEGMIEDFFGAWYDSENSDKEGYYDPDENWNLIFNMT